MKRITRFFLSFLSLCLLFGMSGAAQAQHPATLWLEYNFDATNFDPSNGVYVVDIYGAWQDTISNPKAFINLNVPTAGYSSYFDDTNTTVSSDSGWFTSNPVFVFYGSPGNSYTAVQFYVQGLHQAPAPRRRIATVTFRLNPNPPFFYGQSFSLSSYYTPPPPTGNNQTGFQYKEVNRTLWSGLTAAQPTTLNTDNYSKAGLYPAILPLPLGPIDTPPLTSLSQYEASAGDPGFTLSLYSKEGFYSMFGSPAPGSPILAHWNRSPLPTTVVSANQLDAQISADDLAMTGTNYILVSYGDRPNSLYTNYLPFIVQTAHISGKVTLEGSANAAQPLTFTLTSPLYGPTVYQVTPAADGSFDLGALLPDAYTLSVKNFNSLRVKVAADSTGGVVSNLALLLPGGDANGDNSVDATDFGIFVSAYNSSASVPGSGYDAAADFNGDGSVDPTDFGILVGNYGDSGDAP